MENKKVHISESFYNKLESSSNLYVHIIMVATKPDIIKQAPLYLELKKRGELVLLVHTGQHYDYNLSEWVLAEFWMEVDVNLNIFGSIHKKYALIVERLWDLIVRLKEEYERFPIPYVHWDTLTAASADKWAFLNKTAVVHVEAWIRTFALKSEVYKRELDKFNSGEFSWEEYYKINQDKSNFERGSIEPYPEQFNTRSIEASTWFYAIPTELSKETLLEEWFPEDRMKVVWNSVYDAIKISEQKINRSKAFQMYPNMRDKKFIFVTIHRRENTENEDRFMAIYYALKKLIQDWVNVCFLGLYASENAIDKFGLREDIENLRKNYPNNFAYWPALAHHHEVIDMMSKAWAVVSDSGSMQEEANIVWVPCVTVRFGSDRSETMFYWCNIIAPPISSRFMVEVIKWAIDNPKMRKDNIYWEEVSWKIVDETLKILKKSGQLFRFDDERLDLKKYYNFDID